MTAYKTTPVFLYDEGDSIVVSNSNTSVPAWNEYAIKGQMIIASLSIDESKISMMGKDEIKQRLAVQLAEKMLGEKCIDFTRSMYSSSMVIMIRARAFVVPNNNVQLLRTLKNERT